MAFRNWFLVLVTPDGESQTLFTLHRQIQGKNVIKFD